MASRAASNTTGYAPECEVIGSAFDERKPPSIPNGLRKDVRAHLKKLLASNSHLWDDSQVLPLQRLATLYADIELMGAEIDKAGFMVISEKGEEKVNPMIPTRDVAMRGALALERQLGITFAARGANVKKSEQAKPAAPAKSTGQAKPPAGMPVRKLRLA